jgi:hypothetical protein
VLPAKKLAPTFVILEKLVHHRIKSPIIKLEERNKSLIKGPNWTASHACSFKIGKQQEPLRKVSWPHQLITNTYNSKEQKRDNRRSSILKLKAIK